MESLGQLFLLVWENNVASESLSHQEILAECTRTSSQDLVRISGDDGTQSEDKVMDHLLVQEVGCHCIRYRIFGELLRFLPRIWQHELWVELHWIISELGFGNSLEPVTSLRKIGISFNPVKAVQMCCKPSKYFLVGVVVDSNFLFNFELIVLGSILDERPIEIITVKGCEYLWLGLSDVFEELYEQALFISLIKHFELTNVILRFGAVLKVLDVSANHLPVGDQETLSINDVGDHHDLVEF